MTLWSPPGQATADTADFDLLSFHFSVPCSNSTTCQASDSNKICSSGSCVCGTGYHSNSAGTCILGTIIIFWQESFGGESLARDSLPPPPPSKYTVVSQNLIKNLENIGKVIQIQEIPKKISVSSENDSTKPIFVFSFSYFVVLFVLVI